MKENSTRNYYLDNVRGIAAIMIILIHTAWHSGVQYVPELIRNMTLIIDVPLFFYLAGWSFNYCKSEKKYITKLLSTHFQYMFYITIVFILIISWNLLNNISSTLNMIDLIKWYFYNITPMYPLISVESSLWFFPVYFFVSISASAFLTINNKKHLKEIVLILVIIFALISFKFNEIGNINIYITLNYFIYYSFLYLLGYILSQVKINFRQLIYGIAIIFTLLLSIYNITGDNILNLQLYKFPPHFIYLLWSLIGVLVVLYFKNYDYCFKKNILSFMGQNAIYAFFAQGMSSSLLYKIVPYINMEWYFKLPICFIINLIMAILLIFTIKYSYNLFIKFVIIAKEKIVITYNKINVKNTFINEKKNLS